MSGGGICSTSTCEPLGTSWSLVSVASEVGCRTELADGAEGLRVEGRRRLSAVRLPCQWTVMNKDEEDKEHGEGSEGTGQASRNPVCMHDCLAWGSFWAEFAHLDIRCTWKKGEWLMRQLAQVWNRTGCNLPYLVYCYHSMPFVEVLLSKHSLPGGNCCSEIKEVSLGSCTRIPNR